MHPKDHFMKSGLYQQCRFFFWMNNEENSWKNEKKMAYYKG